MFHHTHGWEWRDSHPLHPDFWNRAMTWLLEASMLFVPQNDTSTRNSNETLFENNADSVATARICETLEQGASSA